MCLPTYFFALMVYLKAPRVDLRFSDLDERRHESDMVAVEDALAEVFVWGWGSHAALFACASAGVGVYLLRRPSPLPVSVAVWLLAAATLATAVEGVVAPQLLPPWGKGEYAMAWGFQVVGVCIAWLALIPLHIVDLVARGRTPVLPRTEPVDPAER